MKILITASVLAVTSLQLNAQDTTNRSNIAFSGGMEVYYSYDLGKPSGHERPPFFYSFNRHNELNLNLGYLKASYNSDKVRGNFALMSGSYAQYNLSAEHPVFQHVLEANLGVKLSKKKNLWVDAGVMSSHIGFESAIGKDCWNLSRSILAENSPYYESGIKLNFTSANEKWYMAALFLNGWQHIQRAPYNNTPSFGTQLTFKPGSKATLNWSTFIGNEKPDTAAQWRYFNNFYGQFQVSEKLGVIAGFDFGMEEKANDTTGYNNWYSPVLIVRYNLTDKLIISARGEYYTDKNGVIIATGTPNGFQTSGYSVNLDYWINKNTLWRIEGRGLNSKDKIFTLNDRPSNQNYFITTSFSISF